MNRAGWQRAVVFAITVVALTAAALLLRNERPRSRAAFEEVSRQNAELRGQLETHERTIAELQNSIRQLQAISGTPPNTLADHKDVRSSAAELEAIRRWEAIASTQTQTLALIEKLAAKVGAFSEPERTREQAQAAIAGLEEVQAEHQKKSVEANQRVIDLLIRLRVPDEVSVLDTEKALNMGSLQQYWPYFEARRERDNARMIAERLKLRLAQEQIDAGIQFKNSGSR